MPVFSLSDRRFSLSYAHILTLLGLFLFFPSMQSAKARQTKPIPTYELRREVKLDLATNAFSTEVLVRTLI